MSDNLLTLLKDAFNVFLFELVIQKKSALN